MALRLTRRRRLVLVLLALSVVAVLLGRRAFVVEPDSLVVAEYAMNRL